MPIALFQIRFFLRNFVAMQWMREIALFLILLPIWCCAEREPSRNGVVCSQLSAVEQAAELMAAVREHAHLNVPTTLESLPSTARLAARTTAKTHTSRYGQGHIANLAQLHRPTQKSYGGEFSPQAATAASEAHTSARLCRWII